MIDDSQILICPVCQEEHPSWTEELRVCPRCGSTRLSLKMGSLACRACGYLG